MAKQLIKGYEKVVPVVVYMRKIYEFDNGIEVEDTDKISDVITEDIALLHATKVKHQIRNTNLWITLVEDGDSDNKSVSTPEAAELFKEIDDIIEEHAENCNCYLQECCTASTTSDECCDGECSTWHNIAKNNTGDDTTVA